MTLFRIFIVIFSLFINIIENGVLSTPPAILNQVGEYGLNLVLKTKNGVSSVKELEHFFKNVYTVPDFLFNVSKRVHGELKNVEEDVENEMKVVAHDVANLQFISEGCHCEGYACGCCAHLEEDEIHLNSTICVNVSYLPNDYGVSFVMTLNEYVLYNETISVRNPPPICVGMPFVKEFAELCVRMYDIDAKPTKLHACVRVEARMKHVLIAKYELGCFDLGKSEEDWLWELGNSILPSVIQI